MIQAKFSWITSPVAVFPNGFRIWSIRKRAEIVQMITMQKPTMLAWVRSNAVWKDRTTNAKRLFRVNVTTTSLTTTVSFEHGVFYGIYLETHNAGRFAIINRAMDFWGPMIMTQIQGLL